jgi:preprotein translocase subunit SecE
MSTKTETGGPGILDTVKLLLAALVLVGGIVAYYAYVEQSVLLAVVAVLVAVVLSVVLVLQTEMGRELWRFIQGSRVELRKVIWPTRQETLQTTMMVLVFALILGIFFWLLDMGLLSMTRFLTGQGG